MSERHFEVTFTGGSGRTFRYLVSATDMDDAKRQAGYELENEIGLGKARYFTANVEVIWDS